MRFHRGKYGAMKLDGDWSKTGIALRFWPKFLSRIIWANHPTLNVRVYCNPLIKWQNASFCNSITFNKRWLESPVVLLVDTRVTVRFYGVKRMMIPDQVACWRYRILPHSLCCRTYSRWIRLLHMCTNSISSSWPLSPHIETAINRFCRSAPPTVPITIGNGTQYHFCGPCTSLFRIF